MRMIRFFAVAISLYAAAAAGPASGATFATFDAPGAGTAANQGTYPFGINADGTIAGYFLDAGLCYHGFLRTADGTITTFDVPGAGTGARQGTTPLSINRDGAIAGYYYSVAAGTEIGFIRSPGGDYQTFAVPAQPLSSLFPNCINAAGTVVGTQVLGDVVGFVRAPNGTFTTLEIGQAWSVNDAGTIAGTTYSQAVIPGVYLLTSTGGLTKFRIPSATFVVINDGGAVAGTYDPDGTQEGFLLASDGTVTPIIPPGAGASGTLVSSMNAKGAITGYYGGATLFYHGFRRSPDGTIVTFDVPAAAGIGTLPQAINAAGSITGSYMDANECAHGFLRIE